MAFIDTATADLGQLEGRAIIFISEVRLSDLLVEGVENTGKGMVLSSARQTLGAGATERGQDH